MTQPHSSWTKFYRLIKPVDRPIGKAANKPDHLDGAEYLATTAKRHYEVYPSYRPPELVDYLANAAKAHLEPVPTTAPTKPAGWHVPHTSWLNPSSCPSWEARRYPDSSPGALLDSGPGDQI